MDQEQIQKLQFLEQSLQQILMQKQAFQMDLSENISALEEIKKSDDTVYKVIGQLMIKVDKEKITEELIGKEKIIKTRIDSLEKQEQALSDQATSIREELMKSVNKK